MKLAACNIEIVNRSMQMLLLCIIYSKNERSIDVETIFHQYEAVLNHNVAQNDKLYQ